MGCCFSSEWDDDGEFGNTVEHNQPSINIISHPNIHSNEVITQNRWNTTNNSDARKYNKVTVPKQQIRQNLNHRDTEFNEIQIKSLSESPKKLVQTPIRLSRVEDRAEFLKIERDFMRTTQRHYKVISIHRVINPYLQISYAMRKKEYQVLFGEENVVEKLMYHGTAESNVEKITDYNLDWRLHGQARGNKFGKGVSLTPISNYASNYGDKTEMKCMFVVTMLYAFSYTTEKPINIPPLLGDGDLHYDTTQRPNGHVIVKFRDDEYYPKYLIRYSGSPLKKNLNSR